MGLAVIAARHVYVPGTLLSRHPCTCTLRPGVSLESKFYRQDCARRRFVEESTEKPRLWSFDNYHLNRANRGNEDRMPPKWMSIVSSTYLYTHMEVRNEDSQIENCKTSKSLSQKLGTRNDSRWSVLRYGSEVGLGTKPFPSCITHLPA